MTTLIDYRYRRYWYLHCLLQVAVQAEIGGLPKVKADKERRLLQKLLADLRREPRTAPVAKKAGR